MIDRRAMKRITFITSAVILSAMTVSCAKMNEAGTAGPAGEIVKIVSVEAGQWLPEDTRTAYEPGAGLVWTGNETMDIYYGNPAARGSESADNVYMRPVTSVRKISDGRYSVSHPEIDGVTEYDYCIITPALSTTGTNDPGTACVFAFSPVQTPGADTFDANYDVLYGRGAQNVAPASELSVTEFKRLFVPLRLRIGDSEGILGSESVRAVTLSFSAPADRADALTGMFYLNFGYGYDECKFNSGTGTGNAVTALYASGLPEDSEGYRSVWYMVKPSVFESGVSMTVTVTSDTKTVSRSVSLTGRTEIMDSKLNSLTFNISGQGYSVENSFYQDFTSLESLGGRLTASDGNSYGWTFDGCTVAADENGSLPSGLSSVSGNAGITLPLIPGRRISKVRLYANPMNAVTGGNTVSIDGSSPYNFINYYGDLPAAGGVLEIEVSDNPDILRHVLTTGSQKAVISAISCVVEDSAVIESGENPAWEQEGGEEIITAEEK